MTSPAATGQKRIALAAVAGAHGIKGEVRLKLFAESVDSLSAHKRLFVGGEQRAVRELRPGNKTAIARFEGISDRSAAEALRGSLVEVDRAALPALEDGEYYHADMIGLPCVDGAGRAVGTVAGIEDFGAGELLEIALPGGKRTLIPFRDPIAVLGEDRVTVDPEFLA
ncbi:MAG: ribosome maturation factor RimM [Pseudomonadota bacterium]|nr:ribosome maturation factor RimM [Pseudomonadota bacterium]